jgi:hypothetical protein
MPEHDWKAFAVLVLKMRAAQKDYFKTKNPQTLYSAKSLERQVDQRAEEIANGRQEELKIP